MCRRAHVKHDEFVKYLPLFHALYTCAFIHLYMFYKETNKKQTKKAMYKAIFNFLNNTS